MLNMIVLTRKRLLMFALVDLSRQRSDPRLKFRLFVHSAYG
jgi:hypothetical protein